MKSTLLILLFISSVLYLLSPNNLLAIPTHDQCQDYLLQREVSTDLTCGGQSFGLDPLDNSSKSLRPIARPASTVIKYDLNNVNRKVESSRAILLSKIKKIISDRIQYEELILQEELKKLKESKEYKTFYLSNMMRSVLLGRAFNLSTLKDEEYEKEYGQEEMAKYSVRKNLNDEAMLSISAVPGSDTIAKTVGSHLQHQNNQALRSAKKKTQERVLEKINSIESNKYAWLGQNTLLYNKKNQYSPLFQKTFASMISGPNRAGFHQKILDVSAKLERLVSQNPISVTEVDKLFFEGSESPSGSLATMISKMAKESSDSGELDKILMEAINSRKAELAKARQGVSTQTLENFDLKSYPVLFDLATKEMSEKEREFANIAFCSLVEHTQFQQNLYAAAGGVLLVGGVAVNLLMPPGASQVASYVMIAGSLALSAKTVSDAYKKYLNQNDDAVNFYTGTYTLDEYNRKKSELNQSMAWAGVDVALNLTLLPFVSKNISKAIRTSKAALSSPKQAASKTISWSFHRSAQKFSNYSPTTTLQNQSWINAAKAKSPGLYVDIENGAIKRLNDMLGDKNLVTVLTNVQKDSFLIELAKLKRKYPDVNFELYSDFKSMRLLAKSPYPENLEAEIRSAYTQANLSFAKRVAEMTKGQIPINENIGNWFNIGFGKSADFAGIDGRLSRYYTRTRNGIPSPVANLPLSDKIEHLKKSVDDLRSSLVDSFINKRGAESLLTRASNGDPILTSECFEILRKYKGPKMEESIEQIKGVFQTKYGLNLSIDEIDKLIQYGNEVDKLAPGLWIAKREFAVLDDANWGGFSVDFSGLGAKNMEQLARDLAETKHLSAAATVERIREGEASVTSLFQQKKQEFRDRVSSVLEGKKKFELRCSGDDCVSKSIDQLSFANKADLVRGFSYSADPSSLRLSFIPPGVEKGLRTQLATQGELLEKKIRLYATGVKEGQISSSTMKKVVIAVDMPNPKVSGEITVHIGLAKGLSLSKAETEALKEALEKANTAFKESLRNNDEFMRLSGGRELSSKTENLLIYPTLP